ncbi:hypothetical protein D3Z52_21590 [Clostridiaceae bacterium]|nr:hypothetical protein [Clostridiaceae bacterium]
MPQITFLLMDSLSAWAKPLNRVSRNLLDSVNVLIFSFSKITPMPLARSIRTTSRESTVFRAKRERDLVRIRSILPRLQAVIIFLNSTRFFMLVPVIPLSAKIPAISQSGFSPIFWV